MVDVNWGEKSVGGSAGDVFGVWMLGNESLGW